MGDPDKPSRKTRLRDGKWFQRLIVWGLLIVLWEIIGIIVGPFFLPRFSEVVGSIVATFSNGDLLTLIGSLRQMLLGFGLAAAIGVPLGLLMGSSRLAQALLGMYISALFVTSLEAMLPFIIILFGTRLAYRVVIVFLFAIFYIIINTAAGVRSVSPNLLETARAFCIPRRKVVSSIIFPSVLPYVIAGLRLGLGNGIKGMIVAELWITVDTGRKLIDLSYDHDLPAFFALAFWIILFGVISTHGLLVIQRRLTPWANPVDSLRKREV